MSRILVGLVLLMLSAPSSSFAQASENTDTKAPTPASKADAKDEEQAPDNAANEDPHRFRDLTRLDFPVWGGVRHQTRSAWTPMADFGYHWQRDVTTNTGTMHGFRGTLQTPADSPWFLALNLFLDVGDVDGRDVRRGGFSAYAGVLFESGEDSESQQETPIAERDELTNFTRRRNFHEFSLGLEWGIVEMKRFINLDDRTYGGFRVGLKTSIGLYGFNLQGGVAAEVYTDRTLYDSQFMVGFGQPWFPVGIAVGYRNLTVKDYHGSFLVFALQYRF